MLICQSKRRISFWDSRWRLCSPGVTSLAPWRPGGAAISGAALAGFTANPASAWGDEAVPAVSTVPSPSGDERTAVAPFAKPYVTERAEREASPKRVLVVIDYQVDFVDGGVFGRIEPAVAIEEELYQKVQSFLGRGDIVIYTMDTHPADEYAQTREGQINPPHCIPGTEGWQIYGKLRDLLRPKMATRVLKGTYGSPELPFVIGNLQAQGVEIEYVEFAGVSTTCRVLHNAIIVFNFFPELPMVFDERTTASYTDERTAEQLDELEAWGFFVRRK